MTSDAKLGLLLGLVIIIAIVFSVNGLPKFLNSEQSDTPTTAKETAVVRVPTEDIISTAKDTVRLLDKYTLPLQEERHDGKSYNIEIPPEIVEAQKQAAAAQAAKLAAEALAAKQAAEAIAQKQATPVAKQTEPATATNLQKDLQAKQNNEYVVQENENLGIIAKKFYGPEEGNKRANILKIAEYNGLKSPDHISLGQTLKIPRLSDRKEFVKVDSYAPVPTKTPVIAKAADTAKTPVTAKAAVSAKTPVLTKIKNSLSLPTVSVTQKAEPGKYVVKNGDTLWLVAQKKLGNGNRFPEIVKLNKNISSSVGLKPGTEIELPTR